MILSGQVVKEANLSGIRGFKKTQQQLYEEALSAKRVNGKSGGSLKTQKVKEHYYNPPSGYHKTAEQLFTESARANDKGEYQNEFNAVDNKIIRNNIAGLVTPKPFKEKSINSDNVGEQLIHTENVQRLKRKRIKPRESKPIKIRSNLDVNKILLNKNTNFGRL